MGHCIRQRSVNAAFGELSSWAEQVMRTMPSLGSFLFGALCIGFAPVIVLVVLGFPAAMAIGRFGSDGGVLALWVNLMGFPLILCGPSQPSGSSHHGGHGARYCRGGSSRWRSSSAWQRVQPFACIPSPCGRLLVSSRRMNLANPRLPATAVCPLVPSLPPLGLAVPEPERHATSTAWGSLLHRTRRSRSPFTVSASSRLGSPPLHGTKIEVPDETEDRPGVFPSCCAPRPSRRGLSTASRSFARGEPVQS